MYEAAWRKPNSAIYYIAPFIKQAKEIIWVNGRLPNGIDRRAISHIDKQELRITLKNDSFIKVDGSDNYDNWAGIEPDLVVLDEFRSFRPQFYEVMNPNRGPRDAPLVIVGTPPVIVPATRDMEEHQYLQLWKLAVELQKRGLARALHFPSTTNDKKEALTRFFAEEHEKLISLGQEDVWRREYLAEFVQSSTVSIFPVPSVFDDAKLIKPHAEVMHMIHKRSKDIEFGVIADPASSSCFGVLFCAFDKYSSTVYYLGELYEKRQENMTARKMWARIKVKCEDLKIPMERAQFIYDEAASWWRNELNELLRGTSLVWLPSRKKEIGKEDGIALMKDMFMQAKCVISDDCEHFVWEAKNAHLVSKMGILVPKKADDHLLDPARYWNTQIGLNFTNAPALTTPENVSMQERLYRSPKELEPSMMDDIGDLPYDDAEFFDDIEAF